MTDTAAFRADRRLYADKHGLCRECAKAPRRRGHVRCTGCVLAKRQHQRDRYARLAAAGLCQECARAPRTPGRVRCEDCAQANRNRVNARRTAA